MDQATLKELLHYDPETGVFTWNVDRQRVKAGSEAGQVKVDGYRHIKISGKVFRAHRLAFLYITGAWPDQEVDHINGEKLDNRWCNLRDVSRKTNEQNARKPMHHNKSGFLGVSPYKHKHRPNRKPKWKAQIRFNGKKKHIGYYDTPEEAHDAYLKAKRELHDGCTI